MLSPISSANGTIVKSLALHNQEPNEGNRGATELAEEAERDLPLRGANSLYTCRLFAYKSR